jgi:hypothetical protein
MCLKAPYFSCCSYLKVVFYQRCMFRIAHVIQDCVVKAACTIKAPCFSWKHITKAPYSSRWLHVLQVCMLLRTHAPQAAYLPWLHVPQEACIVTMAASFYVSQNLFNSRLHFSINYIFPKATCFQEGMFYSRLHVPHGCKFSRAAFSPKDACLQG